MEYERDTKTFVDRGICPFCGEEMETGYLYSGHGIGWTREKPGFRVKDRNTLAWSFWGWSILEGTRCPNCKAIVIPHTEKEIVGTLYHCPHCDVQYHYDLDKAKGDTLICQNCSKEFDIPGNEEGQIDENADI